MLPPFAVDINGIKDKLTYQFRPWQRSFQFWVRAIDIYTGYKVSLSTIVIFINILIMHVFTSISVFIVQVFQVRVNFVKDAQKQEAMWERQHELAADKIFSMCYDLGGFFLKVFQHFILFFIPLFSILLMAFLSSIRRLFYGPWPLIFGGF